MKKYIFVSAVLVGFALWFVGCTTTQKALPPEQLKIQQVFKVNKPQSELFRLSNEWLVKNPKSSKVVVQYLDAEEGVIVGKGFMKIKYGLFPQDLWFMVKIETKDNKARITFEDMYVHEKGTDESSSIEQPIETKEQLDMVRPDIEKLIADYSDYLGVTSKEW